MGTERRRRWRRRGNGSRTGWRKEDRGVNSDERKTQGINAPTISLKTFLCSAYKDEMKVLPHCKDFASFYVVTGLLKELNICILQEVQNLETGQWPRLRESP